MRLIVAIFLISVVTAFSQDDFFLDKRNYYDFGKKFHAEVHYLPSESADSTTALILLRFSYDMISFQKFGINSKGNEEFFSVPEVEIEFEDNDGIIRGKILWQDSIFVKQYDKTISKTEFINHAEKINLLVGKYKVKIRLNDQNQSNIKRIELIDSAKNDYLKNEIISSPIFVEQKDESTFIPYILRNNIKFSSKSSKIIIPVSFKDEFSKYYYSIKFDKPRQSGLAWTSNFSKEEFAIPRKNDVLSINSNDLDYIGLGFQSKVWGNNQNITGMVEINLPNEEIVPGQYTIAFVKDGTSDTIKSHFEVVWEEMPFILQRPRYAIESMLYILNDNEYEKMIDASYENYSKEILNYWSKEDPTKETPYNESMVEYFKRVDYALFNFKTLSEANGIKTDRGKIHILYGKPSLIDRKMSNDITYEFWQYDHLKKLFKFEAKSNGIYKLIYMKDL